MTYKEIVERIKAIAENYKDEPIGGWITGEDLYLVRYRCLVSTRQDRGRGAKSLAVPPVKFG